MVSLNKETGVSWNRILIANRGEIALRIMRTAHAMGFHCIAVFSDADRESAHVKQADQALYLGGAQASESYLNVDRLLELAQACQAQAIHPGYGFLSENADFADRCKQAGLVWIGPTPQAIRVMGDKRAARVAVTKHNVPCVPGYDGIDQNHERLLQEAERIGFPLMVKASMGGGGKGMRLVQSSIDLPHAVQTAQREATAAFGSGSLILEKAIIKPRHVEVQILADQQGNTLHIGERECSLQRRHQKVIEEAPCPILNAEVRSQMGETAVAVARSVNYCSAGTVEFLLDQNGSFYFLEMNTRIQVEHPVTEEIYGVDLIEWQIRIAQGSVLPWKQSEVDQKLKGHAIEVRLYAEDASRNFMPQAGKIQRWVPPQSAHVRVDACIGESVSPFYDPMMGKIITWGHDRQEARLRMLKALQQSVLLGPIHNQDFLQRLLELPQFIKGEIYTHLIDDLELTQARPAPEMWVHALAVVALSMPNLFQGQSLSDGWGSAYASTWPLYLQWHCEGFNIASLTTDELTEIDFQWQVTQTSATSCEVHCIKKLGDKISAEEAITFEFTHLSYDKSQSKLYFTYQDITHIWPAMLVTDPAQKDESIANEGPMLYMQNPRGEQLYYSDQTYVISKQDQDLQGDGHIVSPMNGKLLSIECQVGQSVHKGDRLFTLEAMKLEHNIMANADGIVIEIYVSQGQQMSPQQPLAQIDVSHKEDVIDE
jgi:geranyl-CoA carboxylase alpha subunit